MDKWTYNFDKVINLAFTHYIIGGISNMKIGTNVSLSEKPNSKHRTGLKKDVASFDYECSMKSHTDKEMKQ